jgi:uncharacterized protein YciI
MKKLTALALLMTFLISVPALAQTGDLGDKPKSQPMKMYHIVLAEEGPNWESQNTEKGMDARYQALEGIKKAAASGILISAGLVNDETNVEFILILDVETKTEALSLLNQAPLVKSGFFKPVVYSYFAPEGLAFKK